MFYITGDTHGNFRRFSKRGRFRQTARPSQDDYVIVCGDFGLLWQKNEELKYNLDVMSRYPFTLLWVQGNHENYDMITEYPIELWNGGKVRHILRDKVILLERGQIFSIEGKTFFTFGGAGSHDVQGGILDIDSPDFQEKRMAAVKSGFPYRVRHVSWWEQELPTQEELEEARRNLSRAGNQVDYVITHCCCTGLQTEIRVRFGLYSMYEATILNRFFDELEEILTYKAWYFGHMHKDARIDSKHYLMYQNFETIL